MPRVSVVIPTWNGADLLREALRSLDSQTFADFEVIVVDNGSSDETLTMLGESFPAVRIVALSRNEGFAVAVNAGIRAARGDIIVLMNNDIEATPGWLAALVDALDRHPDVGTCASRMLSLSNPGIIDSAGDMLGLFATSIGHGAPDGPEFDTSRLVFSPCAGAAAYRRQVFDEVGLFDERFFAYLEDVDLGARIQLAGWHCLYVPDAIVHHHGSATARRLPALKTTLLMRNSLFLFFQYAPTGRLLTWAPVMLAWPVYRAVREGRPHLALRALAGFLRDMPAVVRRRRDTGRIRRITPSEFRSRLSGALARPASPPVPPRRDHESAAR
jgi:GT2 family glycosyltransferase